MDPAILTFETAEAAADACGARIMEIVEKARRDRGSASVALSGGSTPKIMFQWMAKRSFDWAGVEFFQVDERCVPPDDSQSNFRMTRESLLGPAKIPESQFHRVLGEREPARAAEIYIEEISRVLHLSPGELPVFDVLQRGMGPDGHTASLFPGEPLIADRTGIAAAVWVEKMNQYRVTLLPGVLEKARYTVCLTTGAEKADALVSVLRGPSDPVHVPSQIASPDMTWYLDKSAGSKL
jgi:6-phosphogluconolactonase